MINRFVLKILLAPLSLLYGMGVYLRNFLYDNHVLRPVTFNLPVISIGNLNVGGSGKTPHVEYIVRALKDYIHVGIMSRGYKRKTKGFRMVYQSSRVEDVGDEPLQFKLKYPDISVAVSESRALGIPSMLGLAPHLQTIVLDDAFQHRSVAPYINILLTMHSQPYFRDFLMPSGRLREWSSASSRADVIIVTKCPVMNANDRKKWIEAIAPEKHQAVFFTRYAYGNPYSLYRQSHRIQLSEIDSLLLLTALASSEYLEEYVESQVDYINHMPFSDHHFFSNYDIGQAISNYQKLPGDKKFILTTEKDAMRLIPHIKEFQKNQVPIYILPIKVEFLFEAEQRFNRYLKNRLLEFQS